MAHELAPWALGHLKLFVGPLPGAFAGVMTAQGVPSYRDERPPLAPASSSAPGAEERFVD